MRSQSPRARSRPSLKSLKPPPILMPPKSHVARLLRVGPSPAPVSPVALLPVLLLLLLERRVLRVPSDGLSPSPEEFAGSERLGRCQRDLQEDSCGGDSLGGARGEGLGGTRRGGGFCSRPWSSQRGAALDSLPAFTAPDGSGKGSVLLAWRKSSSRTRRPALCGRGGTGKEPPTGAILRVGSGASTGFSGFGGLSSLAARDALPLGKPGASPAGGVGLAGALAGALTDRGAVLTDFAEDGLEGGPPLGGLKVGDVGLCGASGGDGGALVALLGLEGGSGLGTVLEGSLSLALLAPSLGLVALMPGELSQKVAYLGRATSS